MARCEWSVAEEETGRVLFQCNASGCGRQIGFVKEGFGSPNPVRIGDTWTPPDDVLAWMDPCPEEA